MTLFLRNEFADNIVKDLLKNICKPVAEYLMEMIENELRIVKNIHNLNDEDLSVFLHMVIHQLEQNPIKGDLQTEHGRIRLEDSFMQIMTPLSTSITQKIAVSTEKGAAMSPLLQELKEIRSLSTFSNTERKTHLPLLTRFRSTTVYSIAMKNTFYSIPDVDKKYPIISYFLLHQEEITLIR